jgi:hypothetical protein
MPERFRKGGDVSALTQAITDGNSADRVALFKQAAAEGSWLAASVKTPQLLEPLIENVTETISAYKSAMSYQFPLLIYMLISFLLHFLSVVLKAGES